jgi:hypothetical protein
MNRRTFFSLLAIWTLAAGSVFAGERPELTAADLAQFTPIAEGIRRATALVLYEGLPHQMFERDQLKNELATKKTIKIHDFHFYERPLEVDGGEVEPLRRLSRAADSYWSYGGPKMCGGYHPDYCLTWKDGEAVYQLLICFGCHEMKLYGPKSELMADIRPDAYKAFAEILKKYRDQRPAGKH